MGPSTQLDNPHTDLYTLQTQLRGILKSVSSFRPNTARPHIIDSSFDISGNSADDVHRQDAVKGLRGFKDSVKRDLDVLEKVRTFASSDSDEAEDHTFQ